MKRRLALGISAVALYLAVIAIAPVPDLLVLFPSTHAISPPRATSKRIAYENGEIEVWIASSAAARAAGRADFFILRFYGNADRPERWVDDEVEMFDGRAVELWAVNYPGFGGSTGPSRLDRIGGAALSAFDTLQRVAGDRPIVISGTSFGTIAALHVAAHRDVAGLLLHNPPALRQMILQQHGWWNLWLLAGPLSHKVPGALDSVANTRRAVGPALFLLAEKDEIVPPEFQKLVVDAYAGEKRVFPMKRAMHNSPLERAAVRTVNDAISWFLGEEPALAERDPYADATK